MQPRFTAWRTAYCTRLQLCPLPIHVHRDWKPPAAADQHRQKQFTRLVGVADRLFAETQHEGAATHVIRAAFQICDSCKTSSSSGHFSEKVFEFEELADRKYMSEHIIPAVISLKPERVLWVGVQPYTLRSVYQMENARIKVSTIEPWDGTAVYGSSKHHMVAGIGSLGEHARPAMFDVIIINGVMGWGLDDEEMIKDGIRAMHTHLKKDGVLVVGHNKLPNRGNCCGYFSPLFSPHGFGGLPTVHEDPESETKHVYEFLTKNDV